MSDKSVLILVVTGIICFALVLFLIFKRLMRKTTEQAVAAQESQRQHEARSRSASYAQAAVLNVTNSVIIGHSQVKVDLRLEVQPPGAASYQTSTCWLIELAQLPQVQPGQSLQVRVDSDDPSLIYPGADWAKLWPWN